MTSTTVRESELGESAIVAIASAFQIDPAQARTAVASLFNSLSERVARNTLSRAGLADVVTLIGDEDAARAAASRQSLASAEVKAAGDGVLDVLIGDKHVSRGIAARAARRAGIDAAIAERMLPAVASLLVSDLQRRAAPLMSEKLNALPGIGDLLPMPGDSALRPRNSAPDDLPPARPAPSPTSPRQPIPRSSPSAGGDILPPMPRQAPRAPRNGYDDLSDVIRKGRTPAPGGGSLAELIRSILAGVLGYKNRGVIGSLIYMLLARFGINILRRVLGGLFGRR